MSKKLDDGIRDASIRSELMSEISDILSDIQDLGWDDVYININPTDGIQYSISKTVGGKDYTEEYDSRNEQTDDD